MSLPGVCKQKSGSSRPMRVVPTVKTHTLSRYVRPLSLPRIAGICSYARRASVQRFRPEVAWDFLGLFQEDGSTSRSKSVEPASGPCQKKSAQDRTMCVPGVSKKDWQTYSCASTPCPKTRSDDSLCLPESIKDTTEQSDGTVSKSCIQLRHVRP